MGADSYLNRMKTFINYENFRLQFITHFTAEYDYVASARMALEGGCRWIQLRMKDASLDEVRKNAQLILPFCRAVNATFLLDDHVELVKELGADGVHLGKNDMPINEARRILGEKYLIGGTANTFEDVKAHYDNGASYIGCGPFRFTTTKTQLSPILGLEGYIKIVTQMKEAQINLPVVAIGGITQEDIPSILSIGIHGIALSSTILQAEDPVMQTKLLVDKISKSLKTN